jgi:hypothetical protein
MKSGDKVRFSFAKKEREGVVDRVFDKTVYIKADFPNHKGKIVRRKVSEVKE